MYTVPIDYSYTTQSIHSTQRLLIVYTHGIYISPHGRTIAPHGIYLVAQDIYDSLHTVYISTHGIYPYLSPTAYRHTPVEYIPCVTIVYPVGYNIIYRGEIQYSLQPTVYISLPTVCRITHGITLVTHVISYILIS